MGAAGQVQFGRRSAPGAATAPSPPAQPAHAPLNLEDIAPERLTSPSSSRTRSRQISSKSWRAARWNRKRFWAAYGILTVLNIVLGLADSHGVASGLSLAGFYFLRGRLHDFGRSGWWLVAMLAAVFVIVLVCMPFGAEVAIGVAVLAWGAAVIAIGSIPGDPSDNRYGPPPGRPELQQVAEVFS